MEFVNRVNVVVIQAMLEIYAINCHVIHVVLNTANARMVHASAHKDGMAGIARCVSISFFLVFFSFNAKKIQ